MPDQVQCPDEHCFWDLDAYKKVIDLCDVVLIACASKFHPMYTEAAIQAGKHVFVEKPTPSTRPESVVSKPPASWQKTKNSPSCQACKAVGRSAGRTS